MKIDKPLYLPTLVRMQGDKPTKINIQRVRRFLRRTEQRHSVQLLIQEYPGGPFYTTITLLKRYLPELFDYDPNSRNEDVEEIRKSLAGLEGRQTALKQRVKALGAEVRQLRSTTE